MAGPDLIMNRYSPSQSLYRCRLGQHWYELELISNRYQRMAVETDRRNETPMVVDPRCDLQSDVVRVCANPMLLAPFLIASLKARRLAKHRLGVIFDVVSAYLHKASALPEIVSREVV